MRRRIIEDHETIRKLACESPGYVPKAWTNLRSHTCEFLENSEDDERNIKEITKDNAGHRGESKTKRKSESRSKKKAKKNISLTRINARNVYDQEGTNRTTDENNNDHFSHGSLQHDFICGKCDETYPDQNMFNHYDGKCHGS